MKAATLARFERLARHVFIACVAWIFCSSVQGADSVYKISSPDARMQVTLRLNESQLSYSLIWKGQPVLNESAISFFSGESCKIEQAKTEDIYKPWKTVWGQRCQMLDQCRQLRLTIHAAGIPIDLFCRVYNDGIAFRYVIAEQAGTAGQAVEFITEYNVLPGSQVWAPNTGAHEAKGPFALNAQSKDMSIAMPTVISTKEELFLGILESDLYSASPFETAELLVEGGHPKTVSKIELTGKPVVTPWRVILVSDQPGDLVVSQTPLNLAAPCELADTSWIKPGKILWDWRVLGYEVDGFKYGVDTASYKRFIDFAAKYGIDYFLIDAKWIQKATPNAIIPPAELDLEEFLAYSAGKGVKVQLYYDRRKAKILKDDQLFPYYRGLGAAGIKYGFMRNKAEFTRDATRRAANDHLLVNYHDDPCPMIGLERTMPNAITREWCHAQQDCKRAFSPGSFLKMAFLNALSGPLDQANGIFGLNGVNQNNRQYSPEEKESYNSTVASEAARVLVTFGGLTFLPDAPEEYEKKADLFEFLQKMPATWDESRVINGRIGEYITTARRSGEDWFVGSVIDEDGGVLEIPLDFLKEGVSYAVTYYEDAPETHFVTNRESYQIRTGVVTRADTVAAKMAPGGGHCMWIRPQPRK